MVDMYTDGADSVLILLDGILGSDFSSELNIAVGIRMEYTVLSLPVGTFNELIAHLFEPVTTIILFPVTCWI